MRAKMLYQMGGFAVLVLGVWVTTAHAVVVWSGSVPNPNTVTQINMACVDLTGQAGASEANCNQTVGQQSSTTHPPINGTQPLCKECVLTYNWGRCQGQTIPDGQPKCKAQYLPCADFHFWTQYPSANTCGGILMKDAGGDTAVDGLWISSACSPGGVIDPGGA